MTENLSSDAPLAFTVVEVVGVPFHAIWDPRNQAILAAGFATAEDPHADSLLARLATRDPQLAARGIAAESTTVGPIADALRAYAAGDLDALDRLLVLQPETTFRGDVWKALRRVPAGLPVTYTELATMAGHPHAVRAAASACANNLVALIVPCHRIVRRDGGLGGYLFGTAIKEQLLLHEAGLR